MYMGIKLSIDQTYRNKMQVQEVHIAPTISSIPSQHNFKVEFRDTGHDIHGAVYESD